MLKLIIVLGIKEFQEELNIAFKGMNIPIFSKVDMEGFKTEDNAVDMSNWFGKDQGLDFSVMFFAFVSVDKAEDIMKAINTLNLSRKRIRPFHAYQIPLEKFV